MATPKAMPIRMSRPTSGSRRPPPSSRLHEIRLVGQCRRSHGSMPRYASQIEAGREQRLGHGVEELGLVGGVVAAVVRDEQPAQHLEHADDQRQPPRAPTVATAGHDVAPGEQCRADEQHTHDHGGEGAEPPLRPGRRRRGDAGRARPWPHRLDEDDPAGEGRRLEPHRRRAEGGHRAGPGLPCVRDERRRPLGRRLGEAIARPADRVEDDLPVDRPRGDGRTTLRRHPVELGQEALRVDVGERHAFDAQRRIVVVRPRAVLDRHERLGAGAIPVAERPASGRSPAPSSDRRRRAARAHAR